MTAKITWSMYEDNGGSLWGRPDGDDRAYGLDGGVPNTRLESVLVREIIASGDGRLIAHFDGYKLVERVSRGGLAAREFFEMLGSDVRK